jgi:alpha-tubulin suppressor-like RCC1 family protein
MSLVETAIRRRADEVGRWTPSSLPSDVSNWVPFLLQREWRNQTELTAAAGWHRSLFVDAHGALLAGGEEKEEEVGLLGLRGGASQSFLRAVAPTFVPSMAGIFIRAVACHVTCNLAVSKEGQVFEWGRDVEHPLLADDNDLFKWQPPVPTVIEELRDHRVRQVIVGSFHCAAVTEDGALFTWETERVVYGRKEEARAELGYGRFAHDFGVPRRVCAFEGVRVASVAVGYQFTAAVTEDGAAYSFGLGDGRLGHGKVDPRQSVFVPKRIEALKGIHMASVAAGDYHALALTRCGRVYSWRENSRRVLVHGLGSDVDADIDHRVPQLITSLLGEHGPKCVEGLHGIRVV